MNAALLERGIADYDAVYRASWKGSEPFPRFMPELMRAAAGLGARLIDEAYEGGRGALEIVGGDALGMVLPIALIAASLAPGSRESRRKTNLASLAVLAGSLFLRVSIMSAGDRSAAQPKISLRFAQPENLPSRSG